MKIFFNEDEEASDFPEKLNDIYFRNAVLLPS